MGSEHDINTRARSILRFIVGSYLRDGGPVGSRTIARISDLGLSPASIRNVMSDLEDLGFLCAPHISAGRVPTEAGLRFYIDTLMETGDLPATERGALEAALAHKGEDAAEDMMMRAGALLSRLASCTTLVVAPVSDGHVQHIQFVTLAPGRVLVVIVLKGGRVENRLMQVSLDLPPSALEAASNYLNARLAGRNLEQAKSEVEAEIETGRTQLDAVTARLVRAGLEVTPTAGRLIIRGQARLLEDVHAAQDLDRARSLLAYLEERESTARLLSLVEKAKGVQIFIGAQNQAFDQSGWSLILSPYRAEGRALVGAIGVIGPMRLNYDKIIPMVDYTSRIIGHMVEEMENYS